MIAEWIGKDGEGDLQVYNDEEQTNLVTGYFFRYINSGEILYHEYAKDRLPPEGLISTCLLPWEFME